jgi:hypothetical protein
MGVLSRSTIGKKLAISMERIGNQVDDPARCPSRSTRAIVLRARATATSHEQAIGWILWHRAPPEPSNLSSPISTPSGITRTVDQGIRIDFGIGVAASPSSRRLRQLSACRLVPRIKGPRRTADNGAIHDPLASPTLPILTVGTATSTGVVGRAPTPTVGGGSTTITAPQCVVDCGVTGNSFPLLGTIVWI